MSKKPQSAMVKPQLPTEGQWQQTEAWRREVLQRQVHLQYFCVPDGQIRRRLTAEDWQKGAGNGNSCE